MHFALSAVAAGLALAAAPLGDDGFVALEFPLAESGLSLLVTTLDGDATPDVALIVGTQGQDPLTLELFRGDGDGGLTHQESHELIQLGDANNPAIRAADLNSDGRDDFGIAGVSPAIWLNAGGFDFAGGAFLPTGGGEPNDLHFTDLDGDSDLDSILLVQDLGGWFLDTGLNDGNANFRGLGFDFPPGAPSGVARFLSADLDDDGADEIIVASHAGLGLSNAPFPGTHVLSGHFSDVLAADFNADGALDLALAAPLDNAVHVLFNDGSGGFPTSVRLRMGRRPTRLAAGDFRGAGLLDLAVLNRDSHSVALLHNNGSGGFGFGPRLDVSVDPEEFALADMDTDGDLDVVVLGNMSKELLVLLNPRVP
ncbi:MAG: hypothetical protein DHS20C15_30860 [Planctomycetota bacterium]|nr:MAG: hypothetical protein DHS20C15_30860 [Planctomycetota bacterium]